jgi:hypothetical protein
MEWLPLSQGNMPKATKARVFVYMKLNETREVLVLFSKPGRLE